MDIKSVVNLIRRVAGMPVRIVAGGVVVEFFGHEFFEPDPAVEPASALFSSGFHKCYWITPEYMFYGMVKSGIGQEALLFGPASPFVCTREQARTILKTTHQSAAAVGPFMRWLSGILPCDQSRFLDILDLAEYLLLGTVNEKSVQVTSISQPEPAKISAKNQTTHVDFISSDNSNELAESLLSYITHGQAKLIESTFTELANSINGVPLISSDAIRNFKNLLIANAVYASSAAINGGLTRSIALSISDSYIRQVESLENFAEIISLLQKMYLEFAERVAVLQIPQTDSLLVHKLYRKVQEHLDEKLTPTVLSKYMKISTAHLCRSIKANTGQTVSQIVNSAKIVEARRLLAETALSVMQISLQLGFTSQNYFQTVFLKNTGLTPVEYRKKQL